MSSISAKMQVYLLILVLITVTSASLHEDYETAQQQAIQLHSRLTDQDKAHLLAAQQQATVGDSPHCDAKASDPEQQGLVSALHREWKSLKGWTREAAKRRYIRKIQQLIRNFTQTL